MTIGVILDKPAARCGRRVVRADRLGVYEIFDSHFLISRRHRVECGSGNRRAGQRDPGAQQSFPRRAVHRRGLYACRCRWPDA